MPINLLVSEARTFVIFHVTTDFVRETFFSSSCRQEGVPLLCGIFTSRGEGKDRVPSRPLHSRDSSLPVSEGTF